MQQLECIHLVQFFLFESHTIQLDPTSAIIAPNGAGKSALLDALQIVLLGGDRNRIRFNAQAGGSTRARTIRDYCLGVYRSGEEGRKRRTATTYITLVFRDTDTGVPLTAGIALGASTEEAEHRVHGMYMLPHVALTLDDHLEHQGNKTLPLAWNSFREAASRQCKKEGHALELHTVAERFVKDLLHRLRASPSATPDINAYRKAFLNALNLQRVEDVDLFVRTLVAEDRPTDIARFRALLDSFKHIRDRIDQVKNRIDVAEAVEKHYEKIAHNAVRAASYRALSAEYTRDLYNEQLEQAEGSVERARVHASQTQRALSEARTERDLARENMERTQAQLQTIDGYDAQARFDDVASRDRDRLVQLKKDLLRNLNFVRDQFSQVASLSSTDGDSDFHAGYQQWQQWHQVLSQLPSDAHLPWNIDEFFNASQRALQAIAPHITSLESLARKQHSELEQAQAKLNAARENQKRVSEGQAELAPDVVRLMNYLREEGIDARPVCDLVRVKDPAWQRAIEAYLRSNVEALLIPSEQEERATKLYRNLRDGRSVYGVKLALSSHNRAKKDPPPADSVASLLEGIHEDALAFLRRQLGELRCVESESELIRARQGLTADGLLAKGGSIERLRLPATTELRIGASDNRARLRVFRDEMETLESRVRQLEPRLRDTEALRRHLARLAQADEISNELHGQLLEHHQVAQRYQSEREHFEAAQHPDLLRLSEHLSELKSQVKGAEARVEKLIGQDAVASRSLQEQERFLHTLRQQSDSISRQAVTAFADQDVDPNRVERQRETLDGKYPQLDERRRRCDELARESEAQVSRLLPDAWRDLSQYARDHGVEIDCAPNEWRPAQTILQRELKQLRDTDLVRYQGEAAQAYDTAVSTFRASVAATLNDNFTRLKNQIATLNRTLRMSPAFSNNERYQFHYEVLPEFRELERFIKRASDIGSEDTLFGSAGEVPAAFRELIEDNLHARSVASPLDDYRRFYRFEVQIRQEDRVIGTLSERMRSGSGGEHRAPLYVIAGAALAAAYGKSETQSGGLGLILLDEFGDKIDSQNARAITSYLRSLGLQLVLAAPDTAQGTLSGVLDSYIELFRDGDLLQAERIEVKAAARELLLSDQFDLHPELLEEETQRVIQQLDVS